MKRWLVSVVLVALFAPLAGCVKDGRADCPAGRYVCFRSVMEKYTYYQIVDHTTLWLYDTEGRQVFTHSYSPEEIIRENYKVSLPQQPEGRYTLVASMNSGDDYRKTGMDRLEDFEISLLPDVLDTVKHRQIDIHHGCREIVFTPSSIETVEYDTVDMYKNTNHINLKVILDGYIIPEEHILTARIRADNRTYNHLNICNGEYLTYAAYSITVPEPPLRELDYKFTVMHTRVTSDMILTLEEYDKSGRPRNLQQKDIIKDITKIYPTDEELDQEDIFNLEIVLGQDMAIVEIKVNGWYTIRGGEEV